MEERLPVNRLPLAQESSGPPPVAGAAGHAEARSRSDPAAPASATIEPVGSSAAVEPTPVEIEQDKPIQVESIVNPTDIRSVALTGLFLMALLYTLYFTREVTLPVTLALLINFLLRPIIQKLEKFRIPPSISAALVMIVMIAVLGGLIYGLAQPARTWLSRAPAMMGEVGEKLQKLRRPVENVTRVAEKVGQIAQGGGAVPAANQANPPAPGAVAAPGAPAAPKAPQTVQVQRSLLDSSLVAGLLNSTQAFFGEAVVVLILLYFLLASGDFFLRKMIRVIPRLSDKKRALKIAMEMQHEMSRYFLTVTLINAGLGVALSIGLWLVGLPNPVLWGALGGLMNFIPYLGATVNITLTTFVALLSFDTVGQALLVPLVYVAINSIEGSVITPWIMGRQFTLNPVVIFIWLIFWGWMWGVVGALIAVPMLSGLKIFCDHIDRLSMLGEFLGNGFDEKNAEKSAAADAPATHGASGVAPT